MLMLLMRQLIITQRTDCIAKKVMPYCTLLFLITSSCVRGHVNSPPLFPQRLIQLKPCEMCVLSMLKVNVKGKSDTTQTGTGHKWHCPQNEPGSKTPGSHSTSDIWRYTTTHTTRHLKPTSGSVVRDAVWMIRYFAGRQESVIVNCSFALPVLLLYVESLDK